MLSYGPRKLIKLHRLTAQKVLLTANSMLKALITNSFTH